MSKANKESQSSKVVQLRHVFGFRSDIPTPFHFLDENNVVFIAGHNIVIHNIEDKRQTFISAQNNSYDITAIDVYPAKKIIAIAEKTEKCATIQIFELLSDKKKRYRRRKIINCTDIESSEIISLKFSCDSKYLLAIGGAPDWSIINYQREKGRIIHILRNQTISTMPFYCGSYCISDPNLIVCTGHKIIKFYKSEPSELKTITVNLSKRELNDYTSHCWDYVIDNRLLICTENGEILIFDGPEFRGVIDTGIGLAIFSIVIYSKGFIIGCENGTILAYERNNNNTNDIREMYRKINEINVADNNNDNDNSNNNNSNDECIGITHICIPASEEELACITSNNQIYSISLSQVEHNVNDNDNNNLNLLLNSLFHCKGINGLDICICKSYLVTCGYDRSVKIWNYNDKKMIISRCFSEYPLCVAIHPSGLQLIVGFSDKLRLMNILMDDISTYNSFSIKGCTQVKYSNGGQYFAAINASTVQIYSTYTFDQIATLRGHTSKVTSIWWYFDDSVLVTTSSDNSVLVWNINNNFDRTQEHQHKGCSYNCAVLNNKNKKILYCTGSDNTIKIICDGKIQEMYENIGQNINQININGKYLFTCTNSGNLILYELLNNGNSINVNKQIKYKIHNQSITQFKISIANKMLITVSNDGCICLFDINNNNDNKNNDDHEFDSFQTKEILVCKSDLELKLLEIETLSKKVNDLRLHNEYEIKRKEINYNEKLKKVNDKFSKELNCDINKYNALRIERDEMQQTYEETLLSLSQKHTESLQEIENYHKLKITSEKERYNSLLLKLNNLEKQWNISKIKNEKKENNELNILNQQYHEKINNINDEINVINNKIKHLNSEYSEIIYLLENDADFEIFNLKLKYDNILKTERTQTLELRGNNGMLKRQFSELQQSIKNGNNKMEKSLQEQNKLIEEINRFEKDIDGFQREINERDSTIREKNKMIQQVEKKNQELEKFKFVLDYKIHELDRQIKPREQCINEINKQICEMNNESSNYLSNNHHLLLDVKDLKLKLKCLQNQLVIENRNINKLISVIKVIGHQLLLIDKNPNHNHNHIKKGIINLYNNNNTNKDTDQHEEFQRHRNYLERNVQGLQDKLVKDSTLFKKDSIRIRQENVALIKEINQLRKEITVAKNNTNNTNNVKNQIKENQNEIDRLIHLKHQLQSINNNNEL